MIIFYNIVVYALLFLVFPFLPFVWMFSKKRRANLLQRFGLNTGFEKLPETEKRIWVHALSVGEVVSSIPLVKAFKEHTPSMDIVFTVSTKTGFDMASQLLRNEKTTIDARLGYFPFDIGCCINRVKQQIKPEAVIIVETDLWPNFLYMMKKNKIPVALINARMSVRSLKGYMLFKKFSSLFFSSLTTIMVQSPLDKERFEKLDVDKNNIMVSGNIKFDQPRPQMDLNDIQAFKDQLFIKPGFQVIICGSTHEGEEKILIEVYKKLKKRLPQLIMIFAPRDPKRALNLKSLCSSPGFSSKVLSDINSNYASGESVDIVLVDQMGVLAKLYALCDVAFIGGSMVKAGGHNPLEAAAFAKPIVFGEDMSDFVMISDLLMEQGGAEQATDRNDLENMLATILMDEDLKDRMGKANHNLFLSHSGATQKIINHMEQLKIV